ncbi:hypothetical protein DCN13_19095 [Rhodococcus ruber]|nr:hypothetical protein [Rhodococcus ruber]AWH01780.1 hypothetical protein DCN13_19095 [Rhodococcus ruber]
MCALFAASAWCLARPNVVSSTAVAMAAVLWLALNGSIEGRVILSVDREHGLTESDLLSFVGFGICVWGYWSSVRHCRGGPGRRCR